MGLFNSYLGKMLLVADDELVLAERAERDAQRARERLALRIEAVRAGGARKRALDTVLAGGLEQTDALERVRALEPPGVWVLAGGVGCGKTVAATWWLLEKADCARPFFITAEKFEAAGRYDKAFRARWERATAIVLDDLGGEFADNAQHFRVLFEALIDHVSSEMRAMIITTNLKGIDFVRRYEARVVSRIREAGGFFNCAGEDRRRE